MKYCGTPPVLRVNRIFHKHNAFPIAVYPKEHPKAAKRKASSMVYVVVKVYLRVGCLGGPDGCVKLKKQLQQHTEQLRNNTLK